MINSKRDYYYFIEADRIALSISRNNCFKDLLRSFLYPNLIWKFQLCLRKLEYFLNCKKDKDPISFLYCLILTRRFNNLSTKLGFSIPPKVFGPGLSIAHRGTIIVNGGATIGSNCRIHACVNIGTDAGFSDKAPNIGDNCYIGPGVKMYGNIKIADGIAIGANAVVNKSFEEPNIAIAGIPAKKIKYIDTRIILIPATEILRLR